MLKKYTTIISQAVLVMSLAGSANATIISGNHMTDGGKTVNLSGLEWLSFDASGSYNASPSSDYNYAQVSTYDRNNIEAGNGGFINNTSDTWRYATRVETENLLDSLWGGTNESYSTTNFDGASWFMKNIGGYTPLGAVNSTLFHFGYPENTDYSHTGLIIAIGPDYSSTELQNTGWFTNSYGLSTGTNSINNQNSVYKDNPYSHLLVREANVSPVPVPGAVWLFGTALSGLVARRKLKA